MKAWMYIFFLPFLPLGVMSIWLLILELIDIFKFFWDFNVEFYKFIADEIKGCFKKRGTHAETED